MSRASKPRHGHLAPFLADLIARSGLKQVWLAIESGVTPTRLSMACRGPEPIGLDKLLRLVRAAGGTADDERRARVLHALDRGALPIPEGCDETTVAKALAVLEGR